MKLKVVYLDGANAEKYVFFYIFLALKTFRKCICLTNLCILITIAFRKIKYVIISYIFVTKYTYYTITQVNYFEFHEFTPVVCNKLAALVTFLRETTAAQICKNVLKDMV